MDGTYASFSGFSGVSLIGGGGRDYFERTVNFN